MIVKPNSDVQEIWVKIIGYDNYFISSIGRVKNNDGLILSPGTNRLGYKFVSLSKNNIQKTKSIHGLVGQSFIKNPCGHKELNHINGIKSDNRIENLEWCTRSHNIKHAFRLGLNKPRYQNGEDNPHNKLTRRQVLEIVQKYSSGEYTMRELSNQYYVSTAIICKIVKGEAWRHITNGEEIKIQRKNTKVLVLDTQTGIFYDSIRDAAISKGIPIPTLVTYLKTGSCNKTSFIRA